MCVSPDLELIPHQIALEVRKVPDHKQNVLDYLAVGEAATISGENCQAVLESTLRELLLEAGYTEFALACLGWTKSDSISKVPSDSKEIRKSSLTFAVHGPNRYNFEKGEFDTIEAVKILLETSGADCENDELAARVLGSLQRMSFLQRQEQEQKLCFASFGSTWRFHIDGSMTFLLIPTRRDYQLGWYSIEDIEALLRGDEDCQILSKNEPIYDSSPDLPLKKDYESQLEKLFSAKVPDLRLIRIALTKCPFPDLVARYSHKLLP